MARKALTQGDRKLLLDIAKARRIEQTALAAVELQIAQLRREAGAKERAATNELVSQAFYGNRIEKSVIADLGLGAPGNRHAVYDRLKEVGTPAAEPLEDLVEGLNVTVQEDGRIKVTLTDYTHPDLGPSPVLGYVVFDPNGDEYATNIESEDPLWSDKLWALPETQIQVHA